MDDVERSERLRSAGFVLVEGVLDARACAALEDLLAELLAVRLRGTRRRRPAPVPPPPPRLLEEHGHEPPAGPALPVRPPGAAVRARPPTAGRPERVKAGAGPPQQGGEGARGARPSPPQSVSSRGGAARVPVGPVRIPHCPISIP